MSDKEILEKAIQKAIDGGFQWIGNFVELSNDIISGEPKMIFNLNGNTYDVGLSYFIYNPIFAKALWGEENNTYSWDDNMLPDWEFNLMRMVISEDPIKYLGGTI